MVLIAAAAQFHWAEAQNAVDPSIATSCPIAGSIKSVQLHGTWQATFSPAPAGLPANATLHLKRHEEFSDSLEGSVERELTPGQIKAGAHSAKAFLAGDLEDGFVLLDESSDNISISGTWNGELVKGSCGREIRGIWQDTSEKATSRAPDAPPVAFVLKRLAGW